MDAIDVDGCRIAYCQVGAGPAVVLLHGYVGDGEATWHRQLNALADELTLVAWDAPGAGASADPTESLGVAGYADRLAGFIAALGVADPHLVGLSFGGALALAVAGRRGRRSVCCSMRAFHPAGFRAMARASAGRSWPPRS